MASCSLTEEEMCYYVCCFHSSKQADMQHRDVRRDDCKLWLSSACQPAFVLLPVATVLHVRCLASTPLSLSPTRQSVCAAADTGALAARSHSSVPMPLTLVVWHLVCLRAASEPLPLPVRCPYLGGTEERLIEQQAACLRAVTDHQQRQVRATD